MKKFDDFKKLKEEILITELQKGLPLKLQQRYRLEKGDVVMEFYIMSLNEEENEVYMKVVVPGVAHQTITLSSLLAANPIEIDEPENNQDKNKD